MYVCVRCPAIADRVQNTAHCFICIVSVCSMLVQLLPDTAPVTASRL